MTLASARRTAFADDVAVAIACVRRQLDQILSWMGEWAEATGLRLCHTSRNSRRGVAASFRVAGHATYLGIEIVPDILAHPWDMVTAKIEKRIEGILFPPIIPTIIAARLRLSNFHIVSLAM